MRTIHPAFAVAVAVIATAGLPAGAQEAPCGQFTLTGGEKSVEIVDVGAPGTSVGDVRVVERQLLDADGKEVGRVIGETRILRLGEKDDDHLAVSDSLVQLFGETLVVGALFARDNEVTEYTPALDVMILGGTGKYRGAHGGWKVTAGERPTFDFDIACRE